MRSLILLTLATALWGNVWAQEQPGFVRVSSMVPPPITATVISATGPLFLKGKWYCRPIWVPVIDHAEQRTMCERTPATNKGVK